MNNINRIVQDQQDRFSTLPTRGSIQKPKPKRNNKKQQQQQQEQPPQPQQQPIPQTIILECNRLTSRQDESTANAYNTNHRWRTEFSNGIQVRKGDEIKINSAYISSIGVGDLIAWDNLEGSQTQDNKATWLMSYYGINDGLNDKREGYNMIQLDGSSNPAGQQYPAGGLGEFCYDVDNSACKLMRNVNTYNEGNSDNINTYMTGLTWTYNQDPYLPCRFFGETFTIKTPVIDNHFVYQLTPSDNLDNVNVPLATTITMYQIVAGTKNVVDVRNIYSVGQTLYFQSQTESNNPDNTQYYYPNHSEDWIFTISEIRETTNNEYVMVVDSLYNLTGQTHYLHNTSIYNTAKVSVSTLPYRTCSNEDVANVYDYTALSTIIYSLTDPNGGVSNADESNYVNVGDKYKQYAFRSIGTTRQLTKDTTLMYQVNNTQTGNEVFECEIVDSNRTTDDCKIEIEIISLFSSDTTKTDRERQQEIKFKFDKTTTNQMLIHPTETDRINFITNLLESNYFILDFYNPNYINRREIATYFLINPTYNAGSGINILIDNTGIITLQGVRRNQNDDITNILADGQHLTNNKNVVDGQKYYMIKPKQFFTDLTAKYSHQTIQQYRSNTWDWSEHFSPASPPSSFPEVPYWIYIKDNDNSFTNSSISIYNDRSESWLENYSDTFNLTYEGYAWGVKQILLYDGFYDNNEIIPVKHYQQKEFEITQNYSSPANIATAITKQTHDVGLARDNTGLEVPNSKSQGLIQNEFYFPVWSSFDSSNIEDDTTGKLAGTQQKNSFFLHYNLKNPSKHIYGLPQLPPLDEYDIYFRTKYTSVNRPISLIFTNGTTNERYYTQDFRQTWVETFTNHDGTQTPATAFSDFAVNPQKPQDGLQPVPHNIQYARCYNESGINTDNTLDNVIGNPLEYLPNSYASQYCGSNNISLTWDDTISRFKFDYLHQTAVSKFIATNQGVSQDSGDPSTTIYYPSPKSHNGTPYKLPRTRVGGVNIENWTSNKFSYPSTPSQVRTIAGLDNSVDLSLSTWFVVNHNNISPDTPQLQKNYNVVGNRFWNKLGFDNNQIYKTNVGTETDLTTGRYLPKGTTDNLTDVADSISGTKEPTENTPYFNTSSVSFNTKGSTAIEAGYTFSSVGAMNTNNHLNGNGLPNTTGNPSKFIPNVDWATNNTPESPAPPATPVIPTLPFSQYESEYNPDRERNTSYTFTAQSDSMIAGTLPTKTEFPYFLVMSDLIKSDFHVSANQGSNLNCLGVISKANAEQDFYFQYQAPQSFYATKDEIISSITTEIRTPSLNVPSALSPYSSIIYQITRYEPIPIQISPPVWTQQEMAFSQIANLLQQMDTSNTIQPAITADEEMIVNGVAVPASVPNTPILDNIPDMTTDEIEVYNDMINVIRGRIIPPRNDMRREGTIGLSEIAMNQPTAEGDRQILENVLPTQIAGNDGDSSVSSRTIQLGSQYTLGSGDTIVLNPEERLQSLKDFENDSVIHSQGQVAPSYRSRAPTYRSRTTTESQAPPSFKTDASTIVADDDDE